METDHSFGSPWDELKTKLSQELTPEDFKDVIFLMKDKLGDQFPVLWRSEDPSDLFLFLENNITEIEAIEILKNVLGLIDYHPQFSEKSFTDIIDEYENKTKAIAEKFRIYRDAKFIGRRREMDLINASLYSRDKGVWVCGQGGMGKTTLVHEVCFRLSIYNNVHIVNVNLKGIETAGDVARAILMVRDDDSTDSDPNTLMSQAVLSLEKIAETGIQTILLLDSIEDCLDKDGDSASAFLIEVLENLPSNTKLLVTSRIHLHELKGIHSNLFLELPVLPFTKETAELLLKISSKPRHISESECISVLHYSGCSPLAVRLISRAINSYNREQPDMPISQLLDIVQRKELMDPILLSIGYSFDRLEAKPKEDLLRISVFGNSSFETDEVAFVTKQSQKQAILTLMLLRYKNLIEIEDNLVPKRGLRAKYYIHPLVLKFLNKFDKPVDTNRLYMEHLVKKIEKVESTHNERSSEAISVFRDRSSNINMLFKHLQEEPMAFSINRNSYLYKLSEFVGSPANRVDLLRRVADNHRSNGFRTNFLFYTIMAASICIEDKALVQAELYLQEIQDEVENKNCSDQDQLYIQGEYFFTKGRIYNKKGKLVEPEECLRKAKDLFTKSGDINLRFTEVARTLNLLGGVYFNRKIYDKALHYHQKACDIMKQYLKEPNNHSLSLYMFNIGTVKAEQAELLRASDPRRANQTCKEAVLEFSESMNIDIKLNRHRLETYSDKLFWRARLHYRLKNFVEAFADVNATIQLRENIFGSNHSNVTEAYYTLALWFFEEYKNKSIGTSDSRRNALREAHTTLQSVKDQIINGSMKNQDCEKILELYMNVVTKLNPKQKREAERFCNQVRTGTLSSSDSSDETSSPESSSSPSSSSSLEVVYDRRHDSGIAESMSAPEDIDASVKDLSLLTESAKTESDEVFTPNEIKQSASENRRESTKRQRATDSDE